MDFPTYLWGDSDSEDEPHFADVSLSRDAYDRLGRNVSAQERRQEAVPWELVMRGAKPVRVIDNAPPEFHTNMYNELEDEKVKRTVRFTSQQPWHLPTTVS